MSILLSNDISRCSIKALSSGSLLSFGPLWWVGDTGCLGQLHWNHISSHHTMNRIPVCVCVLSSQSCTTLFGPVDCSPLVSSVRGIFQTRILEWGAISYSRGSSQLMGWTHISCISCIGRQILYRRCHLRSLNRIPVCLQRENLLVRITKILSPRSNFIFL